MKQRAIMKHRSFVRWYLIPILLVCAFAALCGCAAGPPAQQQQNQAPAADVDVDLDPANHLDPAAESDRWQASLVFWRNEVERLHALVQTLPPGDRRDRVLAALREAQWWLSFFQGALSLLDPPGP